MEQAHNLRLHHLKALEDVYWKSSRVSKGIGDIAFWELENKTKTKVKQLSK